jgi:hypothetical protein
MVAFPISKNELLKEWDIFVHMSKGQLPNISKDDERLFYLLSYPPFISDLTRLIEFKDSVLNRGYKPDDRGWFFARRRNAKVSSIENIFKSCWSVAIIEAPPDWLTKTPRPSYVPRFRISNLQDLINGTTAAFTSPTDRDDLARRGFVEVWVNPTSKTNQIVRDLNRILDRGHSDADKQDGGRPPGKQLQANDLKNTWMFWQELEPHAYINKHLHRSENEVSEERIPVIIKLIDPKKIGKKWLEWRANLGRGSKGKRLDISKSKTIYFLQANRKTLSIG